MTKRTLLFVHGMYMTGESWQPWINLARAKGYESIAPSWPFHNAAPAALRAHSDPALGKMQFRHVVDSYKKSLIHFPSAPF